MKRKKSSNLLLFFISSGDPIRTNDLWVMSPTSYHCSTPQSQSILSVLRVQRYIIYFINASKEGVILSINHIDDLSVCYMDHSVPNLNHDKDF